MPPKSVQIQAGTAATPSRHTRSGAKLSGTPGESYLLLQVDRLIADLWFRECQFAEEEDHGGFACRGGGDRARAPPAKKAKKGGKASKADAPPEPVAEDAVAGGAATIVVKPLQLDSAAAMGRYVAQVIESNLKMLKSMPTVMSPEPAGNHYNLCAKAMRHLFEERPETSRT